MANYFKSIKPDADVEVKTIYGDKGKTDLVKVTIPGTNGRIKGGDAPTLNVHFSKQKNRKELYVHIKFFINYCMDI